MFTKQDGFKMAVGMLAEIEGAQDITENMR